MRCSANIFFLSFTFLGILSTSADACVLKAPRYQLASDTVRWSLELSGGETCIRGVRFSNVVVDKLMVISAPHNGRVTLLGSGFSYKAARDFQGPDFFSLVVSGATNKVPGSSTIEVEVFVTRASEWEQFSTTIPSSTQAHSSSPSLTGTAKSSPVSSVQKPGPSADLFANPYYTCVTNRYVSTAGNDSNNGSSPESAWATLQRADRANVGAGTCINVAPGTYKGFTVFHGGNAATATGYVVYRCQIMDACTIIGSAGPAGNGAVFFDNINVSPTAPNTVNYVQFDGFVLVGKSPLSSQGPYGVGFNVFNGDNSNKVASHHIWLLNSIVHGFSQSGISLGYAEYQYVIHNTSYLNSNATCDAQGSGISIFREHMVPGYTPTADDQTNPNALLGPTWQVGRTFFHVVVEWNVTYNNALTQCGTPSKAYDTDGNGIIFDTNAGFAGNTDYNAPMLAAYNVSYNNGGGGVHVVGSSNVTVANNSCFNNYLDPAYIGSYRACIDDNGGSANTFINNIAVAIPSVVSTCQIGVIPYTQWNNAFLSVPQSGQPADTFSNNLAHTVGTSCAGLTFMASNHSYRVPPNLQEKAPDWVDVGSSSVGTDTTLPVGTNFALSPGSSAIGAGLTEPYLPSSSVDLGACPSELTTCP